MIRRIRLKHPLWIRDPNELESMLRRVEAEFKGAWDCEYFSLGEYLRVYSFVRFKFEEIK